MWIPTSQISPYTLGGVKMKLGCTICKAFFQKDTVEECERYMLIHFKNRHPELVNRLIEEWEGN